MVVRFKDNSDPLLLQIIIDVGESQRVSWRRDIILGEAGPGEDSRRTLLAVCGRFLFRVRGVVKVVEEFDEDVPSGARRQQRAEKMVSEGMDIGGLNVISVEVTARGTWKKTTGSVSFRLCEAGVPHFGIIGMTPGPV